MAGDIGPAPGAGPAAGPVAAFGYRQELKRSLSVADLLVYGLLYISPTAPFATFGILYNASAGMVPLVYIIGFGAIVFTALSYMALSREFPLSGSAYSYAKLSFGESAGFLAGWAVTLDYLLAPALIYIAAAVAIDAVLPGVPLAVWAGVLLVLNTLVNLRGIESVARANAALLALQVLAVSLFLIFALAAVIHGRGGAHFSLAPIHGGRPDRIRRGAGRRIDRDAQFPRVRRHLDTFRRSQGWRIQRGKGDIAVAAARLGILHQRELSGIFVRARTQGVSLGHSDVRRLL